MQTLITWQQLITYLFIFLAFYYATVLALFYRHDLMRLAGRFGKDKANHDKDDDLSDEENSDPDNKDKFFEQVQELMSDYKTVFNNITNAPISRTKLIDDIRAKVQRYPQIKGTQYQITLTSHIEQETENRLGIKLSDEELESIWR